MFKNRLTKIEPIIVKSKKRKKILSKDELEAELIGYRKQFIKRCKYVFKEDKAVACYMEIETNDPIFLQSFEQKAEKNVVLDGNKKKFEWSDEYFLQKGKGCSKEEIKSFLKQMGYKIRK